MENALEAHSMGRHVSEHPDDKAFWEKTCPACRIIARLQPFMVAGTAAQMKQLSDEQLEVTAALPIDGMSPQEMLDRICAERELEARRG